ncbi:MAG TPA: hypothetical protein DF383_01460 [Deltaproteobacteria bacterium]|nr:hypothetical protein [Deltaproteobacteria bacterium]
MSTILQKLVTSATARPVKFLTPTPANIGAGPPTAVLKLLLLSLFVPGQANYLVFADARCSRTTPTAFLTTLIAEKSPAATRQMSAVPRFATVTLMLTIIPPAANMSRLPMLPQNACSAKYRRPPELLSPAAMGPANLIWVKMPLIARSIAGYRDFPAQSPWIAPS